MIFKCDKNKHYRQVGEFFLLSFTKVIYSKIKIGYSLEKIVTFLYLFNLHLNLKLLKM